MSFIISVFALLIASSSTTIVKWLPNASFRIPSNFKDGKLPCSKQTVVFPEFIVGSIEIASGTEVTGFILPETGTLILDGTLTFGGNPQDNECSEKNAYYEDRTSSGWNQADVWSSPEFNEATPDAERIPCFNDIAEFPKDTRITVLLPKEKQYVKRLIINNRTINNSGYLYSHAIYQDIERQQFVFNEDMRTGVGVNEPMSCTKFGCPCQINPMKIDCSVKFCPRTTCIHPVKPIGFCCEVCGGFTVFDMDKDFDKIKLNELVENVISGYKKNSLIYHIGFVSENPIRRMQLVVIDKGEYAGSSAEVVSSVSYKLPMQWYKGEMLTEISGSPLSKSGLGGKIFVSMFFVVALIFGAIYVYYYKIPDIRFPFLGRGGFASAFSRFERRSDSVVSLTRRDSVMTGRAAFRNPLYDSRRGRVLVTESVVED